MGENRRGLKWMICYEYAAMLRTDRGAQPHKGTRGLPVRSTATSPPQRSERSNNPTSTELSVKSGSLKTDI